FGGRLPAKRDSSEGVSLSAVLESIGFRQN
ncbi:MAG: hypothetical protein ACJAYL_002070, partial [Cryomorphaceae bacterium]